MRRARRGPSAPVRPETSPPRGAKPGPAWIITAGSLPRLAAAGLPMPVLDADFDNPGTLVLGRGRVDDFLPHASPAMVFTSETSLADALNAGQVPAAVGWVVLLDLEHWPLTPAGEQADPIGALRTAVNVLYHVVEPLITKITCLRSHELRSFYLVRAYVGSRPGGTTA